MTKLEQVDYARLPSGRHGLPREVVVDSQRTRMLRAMLEAVAANGYADTSVADVIGRANVSRTTFYEFWPDKEACFLDAYRTLLDLLVSRMEEAYAAPVPWPARVRAGLAELLQWLAAFPDLARVAFLQAFAAGPEAGERYRDAIARFAPFFEAGREQAPHGDELPERTATVVVGGIAAILFDEILAGRTADLPQLLPELVYWAVAPFIGHEQAVAEMETAASSST